MDVGPPPIAPKRAVFLSSSSTPTRTIMFCALIALITTNLYLYAHVSYVGTTSNRRPKPALKEMSLSTSRSPPWTSSKNVTLVTAFFNIGSFAKGSSSKIRDPGTYSRWMRAFTSIANPVVAYFDDREMAADFSELRGRLPTKVVMVDRKDMWAFTLQSQTQAIFDQPSYPKNPPKSTNAAYVCAMHAKYELVERSVRDNPFGSFHFAWLDIGHFRDIADRDDNPLFYIQVPRCHRDGALSFSQVYDISDRPVEDLMRRGQDWVSGAFFLAASDAMLKFCSDYKKRAVELLSQGLANHDQSVILSMYAPLSMRRGSVPLQAFLTHTYDPWFYIAYAQRQEWIERHSAASARGHKCSYVLYE